MKTYLISQEELVRLKKQLPRGGNYRWSTPQRKTGLKRFCIPGETAGAIRDGLGKIHARISARGFAENVNVAGHLTVVNRAIKHQQDVTIRWM
jgi:hypothetical protein